MLRCTAVKKQIVKNRSAGRLGRPPSANPGVHAGARTFSGARTPTPAPPHNNSHHPLPFPTKSNPTMGSIVSCATHNEGRQPLSRVPSSTAAGSASTTAKTGGGDGGGAQTTEPAGVKNDHGGACMYHPDLGYVGDGPPGTEAEAKLFALRAGLLLPADACCYVSSAPICVHVG